MTISRKNGGLISRVAAPRKGPALLGGLIQCGQCGGRLTIHYGRHVGQGWYVCHRGAYDPEAPKCPHVPASVVDGLVSQQVLCALEPASLELSLQASQDVQRERERMTRLWEQRLERARYEAQRAERQYNAVEPENRLVARTLERRWEETLEQERQLQEEHDRFLRENLPQLSAGERERIAALAADIPALWEAPTTTAADRQTIIRHLIQRVVATVPDAKNFVTAAIHWVGGHISQHEARRRVQRFEQLGHFDAMRDRILELRAGGWTGAQIAQQLNQEGFHLPRGRTPFKAINVHSVLRHLGLSAYSSHHQTNKAKGKPHECACRTWRGS
jgi:Recombinase zinc beta ribbon domain